MRLWKVGELAKHTGLTVRALHHYDEIGLLSPSHRSEAGYRLYDGEDIARLLQILSLRQVGFSLDEIGDCLSRPENTLERVLELHIGRLRDGIELQRKLCSRLEAVSERLRAAEAVSVEDFLETMEAIQMFEKHFTEEQRNQIEARGKAIGQDRIKSVEAEWPQLIAKVRAEMDKGTDPASGDVQALMGRWKELLAEFTGGDPGIQKSLNRMYQQEPSVQQQTGIDPALMEYVGKAMAAGKPKA
ncbi:MAG: TipAS antibiotic-recognition domain-containing protein [Acidobacteriota bacterium]